jgi:DNA-directed RNA polymerase subunit E'/Rpb7
MIKAYRIGYSKCTFRMVVFRPFVGEVIEGTIKSSSSEGIIGKKIV